MKREYFSAAILATNIVPTLGQGSTFIAGNYYGTRINAISYVDWGSPGAYQQVFDMSNGECKFNNVTYSGGMAPLDGEISLHFRGPMHLKQFAFYTPVVTSKKRSHKLGIHEKRHFHAHRHHQRRAVEDIVTATINGQVVSWTTSFGPPSAVTTPVTANSAEDVITATINGQVVSWTTNFHTPLATTTPVTTNSFATAATPASNEQSKIPSNSASSSSSTPTSTSSSTNGWTRQAYYNSNASYANGLVFLNNHGGAGSGIFDYHYGMSLSYASSDGTTGAASPEILNPSGLLADTVEVSLWTDQKCSGTDCGYYRPGSVAYHGFNGPRKLFLFEFDMPMSAAMTPPNNMPAIWALNANIARTQQYGSCSCWPGCGEWDIFEVLDPGNFRMSSSVESDTSGRDIDWFERPVNRTMKAAVLFDGPDSAGHIYVLPDDADFSMSLPGTFLNSGSYNRLAHAKGGDGSEYVAKVFSLSSHLST